MHEVVLSAQAQVFAIGVPEEGEPVDNRPRISISYEFVLGNTATLRIGRGPLFQESIDVRRNVPTALPSGYGGIQVKFIGRIDLDSISVTIDAPHHLDIVSDLAA